MRIRCGVVDERADRERGHLFRGVRFEELAELSRIGLRVEPAVVVFFVQDHRHAVVERASVSLASVVMIVHESMVELSGPSQCSHKPANAKG